MFFLIKTCCTSGERECQLFRSALRLNKLDDSYGYWRWNTCHECRYVMIKNGYNEKDITDKQSWIYVVDIDLLVSADIVYNTNAVFEIIKQIKNKKNFLNRIEKK